MDGLWVGADAEEMKNDAAAGLFHHEVEEVGHRKNGDEEDRV